MTPPRLRAFLFNTTARNGHHGCALVCDQIDRLAASAGIDVVAHFGLDPTPLRRQADYDLVLVNGEGTVHHDQPGARRVAEIARLAAHLGKPAYLINAQYEANDSYVAGGVAAFRQRYVRDSVGREEMAAAGLDAIVVPDLSLTWQPQPTGVRGERLVVVDSVKNDVSRELYDLAATNAGRYLTILTEPPVLRDFPDRNALRRAKYFSRRLLGSVLPQGWRREKLSGRLPSFTAFVAALSTDAALVVSGRFHGVCISLALEIPVIGISSNTRKVEALMDDIGLKGRTAKADEIKSLVERRPKDDFRYTSAEIDRIRAFRRRATEHADAMFRAIATDAADIGAGRRSV